MIIRPERSWPRGTVDLLLKAALSPEPLAREAWRAWTTERDFDDVTWWEMRLLTAVALRLPVLDPLSPLRPRVDGLAKQLWTRTQLALREVAAGFDRFAAAGIPLIVFKGGAQYAEGLGLGTRRIIGDVDILVRPEHALAALDVLDADGWTATNGESVEYLRRVAPVRLSGNFRKGEYGEIDLHTSPYHFARIVPALDEELWRTARPAQLALRPVLVPDPTHAALLLLAHSATSDSGDWAIDLAVRIERQAIDWQRLAELAARRGLVPACGAGLRYLAQGLGLALPEAALRAFEALPVPFGERLKYWSNVRDRTDRTLIERAANRVADRLLARQGFSLVVKDRRAITVTRPRLPLRWLAGAARAVGPLPEDEALVHSLVLPPVAPGAALVIRLTLATPPISRRLFFDVTADGMAVARLRSRAGGSARAGRPLRRIFHVGLPPGATGAVTLRIEARPVRFVVETASEADKAAIVPLPFRLSGLWLL